MKVFYYHPSFSENFINVNDYDYFLFQNGQILIESYENIHPKNYFIILLSFGIIRTTTALAETRNID